MTVTISDPFTLWYMPHFLFTLSILMLLPWFVPTLPALNMKLSQFFPPFGLYLVLRIPLSQIWYLVFTHALQMLDYCHSSGFFLPSKYLWLFIYSFPILLSVLTTGINSITILLLKLGTGNYFPCLDFCVILDSMREGLCCVSISPFLSSGSALRRCQRDVFMGWEIIRLRRLFISCATVRT